MMMWSANRNRESNDEKLGRVVEGGTLLWGKKNGRIIEVERSVWIAIVCYCQGGGKQLIQRRVNEVSFEKGFIINIMQATLYWWRRMDGWMRINKTKSWRVKRLFVLVSLLKLKVINWTGKAHSRLIVFHFSFSINCQRKPSVTTADVIFSFLPITGHLINSLFFY